MKKHLIITSALYLPDYNHNFNIIRLKEYQSSFFHALKFKDDFDTMTVIECISKEKIDDLEECGIPIYYSNSKNTGIKYMDELHHCWDFIKQDFIGEDDIIIKLSGRYILCNTNILSYFNDNIDFVVKDDRDMYPDPASGAGGNGVHTFLYGFRKRFFRKFYEYSIKINSEEICQLEHLAKRFALLNKKSTLITDRNIGVITSLIQLPISSMGNLRKMVSVKIYV